MNRELGIENPPREQNEFGGSRIVEIQLLAVSQSVNDSDIRSMIGFDLFFVESVKRSWIWNP